MFGAATCFGIAVLTKETMLLLPMFAWLVWTRTAPVTRRTRRVRRRVRRGGEHVRHGRPAW